MKNRKSLRFTTIFVVFSLLSTAVIRAGLLDGFLGKAVKTLAVGALVSQFGPEINKNVNRLTGHEDSWSSATKVVPILTIGSATAIGAAQVKGARKNVKKVKAVGQIETKIFGSVRIRALIPIESKEVFKGIRGVEGVGVSALIDSRL